MKTSELDQQLDDLLEASREKADNIIALLVRYTQLASGSNARILEYYAPKIDEVCAIWESEIEDFKGIRMMNIGLSNYFGAHFHEAVEPLEKAIDILKDSKYSDLYAISHMLYGGNKRSLGEFDTAVEHLMQGVEIIDPNGDFSVYRGLGYYQLAEINVHIHDFEAAERNYKIAVEVSEKLKNNMGLFRAYNGMANFCLTQNSLEESKMYLDKSLALEGITVSQKSRSYCDLGVYYFKSKNHKEAEVNFLKSYQIRIEAGLRDAASTSLFNLSKVYIETGRHADALKILQEAMEFCKESKSKSKMIECLNLLAHVHGELGNWESSSNCFKKHVELQKEMTTSQLQNIYNLKNSQIKRQKQIIEEAHKEITDSIAYAKRIQYAILPPAKFVNQHLPNAFILYKPKDIVAGDFYWMEHKEGKVLYAAADCTGHGVPGAMVSVICNNGLNRSVREFGLTDPGEILNKTREIVIQEFEKSDEEVKDGMDIALCSLEGTKLQFAGAHNPLWIVRNGEVLETKADKQPIGKFYHATPYATHSIDLEKGDSLYIFSDGYVDQFGGPKGKKFRAKQFRELLLSIQEKSMEEQRMALDDAFLAWCGKEPQVDDVCIIGVRV